MKSLRNLLLSNLFLLFFVVSGWSQGGNPVPPLSGTIVTGKDGTFNTDYVLKVQSNLGGVVTFRWITGGDSPTNCDNTSPPVIFITGRTSPSVTITDPSGGPDSDAVLLAQQLILCNIVADTFETQVVYIPAFPTTEFFISYQPNGTTSGTYELSYVFPREGLDVRTLTYVWPPRTAVGTWAQPSGLAVGRLGIVNHVFEVEVTGTPATCTLQMQGSNGDLLNFAQSPHNWFNVGTAITCTTAQQLVVVNVPAGLIRPNLTVLTGGTSPSVRVWYLGTR